MKKTFLLLIFLPLISSLCAQNQTDKGRILLSTSSATCWNSSLIGVGTSQNKGYAYRGSSSVISLSPGVGYFVMKNLAIGVDMNLSFTKSKSQQPSKSEHSIQQYEIGPALRYYMPINRKIYPFVKAGYSFGYFHRYDQFVSNGTDFSGNYSETIMKFYTGAGISIPASDKWLFDLFVSKSFYSTPGKYIDDKTPLNFHIGISYSF